MISKKKTQKKASKKKMPRERTLKKKAPKKDALKNKAASSIIVAQLNARIQPMHRGEFFEDPLDKELKGASSVKSWAAALCRTRPVKFSTVTLRSK